MCGSPRQVAKAAFTLDGRDRVSERFPQIEAVTRTAQPQGLMTSEAGGSVTVGALPQSSYVTVTSSLLPS